jgi:hydrogenase nickel incorporation protein HypB
MMHEDHDHRHIAVAKKVMGENDRLAEINRRKFGELGLFVINVMSSPGSGKTTLLQRTLEALKGRLKIGVVVGDICTTNDAERLSLKGEIPAVQICTDAFGGDCHLTAPVVWDAASGLDLKALDLLIVENVGNLVCPAEFDIGEDRRVVVLSVTEGEDKPSKYPLMFQVCDLAILGKIDLLPHIDYDVELARKHIRGVHPHMPIIELSARTGEGMEQWTGWLEREIAKKKKAGGR